MNDDSKLQILQAFPGRIVADGRAGVRRQYRHGFLSAQCAPVGSLLPDDAPAAGLVLADG